MQVACPHCQTKLQLSAAKLPDTPFAIKCPKCETTFQVTPPAPEAAPSAVAENVAPPQESTTAPAPPAPPAAQTEPPAPAPPPPAPVAQTEAPAPPIAQSASAAPASTQSIAAPQPPPAAQAAPQAVTAPAPPVAQHPEPSAPPPTRTMPPAPVMQTNAPAPPPQPTTIPQAPQQYKRPAQEDELLAGKGTMPNMAVGWTHSMPTPTASDDSSSLLMAQGSNGDLLQTLAALLSGGTKANAHHAEQTRKRNIVACLSSQEDLILLHNIFNNLPYELMVAGTVEEVTGMLQSGTQLDILLLDPNYQPEQQGCPSIMRYVNMLNPARRRRLYVGIISQSYRTLDTQTAFSHGVNLIVNTADLEQLPVILTKSILDFNNLYRAYNIASGTSPF